MAKINKTKYALLGVLSQTSGSGYDIKKFCDSSIGHFWNENYGHIYPVLKKMEEEELITKKVEQKEGRPSKNIYSITKKGQEDLEQWLMSPVEQNPIRSELLLKIFWSKGIPVRNIIEKIQNVKQNCERDLEQYSKLEEIFTSGEIEVDKKNIVLWLSTIKYGKYGEEAQMKWCEETLEMLEEIKDI